MAASDFWRIATSELLMFRGVPAEVQRLSPDSGSLAKVRSGHGLLAGAFNEETGCGEVNWIASIEDIDQASTSMKLNWRNADITLKPTGSGAVQWRKRQWFGFDPDVADRYMLDALFADVFDDESWRNAQQRVDLVADPDAEAGSWDGAPIAEHSVFKITKPSRRPRVGYVYLVRSEHGIKIGKSVNVKHRTRLFSVKLPFPIKVDHYAKFSDYTQAERTLHVHFHSQRLDGEWFNLSEADVELIKTFGEPQSVDDL
jgi:hypothetical protein